MVRIYEIDKAFAQWIWLCDPHLARRKAMGFLIQTEKAPPHGDLACADCFFGEPTTTPTKGTSDGTGS